MFKLIDVNLEKEMDNALHYLAQNLRETGNNSKPVLLHSFKLAMNLYMNEYEKDIIIAGILHDIIEDTDMTKESLEKDYDKKICDIVEAVSFNPKIEDKLEQAKEMFKNCCHYGKEALIVKCADLLDNINFVCLVDDKLTKDKLLKKYELFLEISYKQIGKEKIYIKLKNKYEEIKQKI